MRRAALLLVLVVALAACARTVDGTATAVGGRTGATGSVAPSGQPDRHGLAASAFDDTDLQELHDLATWHTWDPCGLLDHATLTSLGTPKTVDGADDLDGCTARVTPPGADRFTTWTVRVRVGVSYPVDVRAQDMALRVAGTEVFKLGGTYGKNSCTIAIPQGDRRSIDVGVSWESNEPAPAAACTLTQQAVTTTLPLLQSPTLRSASAFPPVSPLTTADPCAGMDAFAAAGETVSWAIPQSGVHDCFFELGQVGEVRRTYTTLIGLGLRGPFQPAPTDSLTTISGFKAQVSPTIVRERPDPIACSVTVLGTQPVDTGNPLDAAQGLVTVGRLFVSAPTCAAAAAYAAAIVTAVTFR